MIRFLNRYHVTKHVYVSSLSVVKLIDDDNIRGNGGDVGISVEMSDVMI